MYHSISPRSGPLVVSPDSFSRQQEHLAREYNVVSLDQVCQATSEGSLLPPRSVLLTFDDGYRDNLEIAKPVLDNYGHPATIFVAADLIGLGALRYRSRTVSILSWDELRDLSTSFSVGSQGLTHRVLTKMLVLDAERELRESKRVLEERLDRPVVSFSYPKGSIGDFNAVLEHRARDAGYWLIFTGLPGLNRPPLNPYRMRRHHVEDFGMDYFQALLDGSAALLALKDTRVGYWTKRTIKRRRVDQKAEGSAPGSV
jgi:peptidoglycan/xylan/chitin deacetylase (PgdA/CDA1 family)